MLDRKTLQALGCWTGYRLDRVEWPGGESRTLSLYLKPVSKLMFFASSAASAASRGAAFPGITR